MQRLIEKHLSEWFTDKDRKILLLRGARQVGKTFSVREFGRRFKKFVEQAGRKFKYAAIGPETTAAYRQALELLIQAGIAYPIYHTAAQGLPLGGQIGPKRFKIAFFDCGLFQRLA